MDKQQTQVMNNGDAERWAHYQKIGLILGLIGLMLAVTWLGLILTYEYSVSLFHSTIIVAIIIIPILIFFHFLMKIRITNSLSFTDDDIRIPSNNIKERIRGEQMIIPFNEIIEIRKGGIFKENIIVTIRNEKIPFQPIPFAKVFTFDNLLMKWSKTN